MEGVNSKEVKDSIQIEPIKHGIIADTHSPPYLMHRYFARRPYNVFNNLIMHYSNPGDIILDPFSGGGVTVFEGLRLGRKVIGVDFNPMAIFITKMEIKHIDINELNNAYKKIEQNVKNEICKLYITKCPKCKGEAIANWYEFSYIITHQKCKNEIILSNCKKEKKGIYICSDCNKKIISPKIHRDKYIMIRIKYKCGICKDKGEKQPDEEDLLLHQKIENEFESIKREKELWYPEDIFPDANYQKENALYSKGFTHFYLFFTRRNLLALSILFKQIQNLEKNREDMKFIFSSMLFECASFLCHIKGGTVVKPGHHYWPANIFASNNVWLHYLRRYRTVKRGKEYSNKEIKKEYSFTEIFENLKNEDNYMLLTKSSTNLPLSDNSIDVIITDPPYGKNVQYAEMSDFWTIWLRKTVGSNGLIDNKYEAIQTRHSGFKGAKSIDDYKKLLYQVFKECHRVLKRNGWMVMTFHNKEISVWNSLLIAIHDAGFILPEKNGVIYQPPIKAYTTTSHQKRSGSMLGDFIISLKRVDKLPEKIIIDDNEIEEKVIAQVKDVIRFHGGASLSKIYMQLMPFLTNQGVLHKIAQKDLKPFLRKDFEKKGDRWYFREHIDEDGNVKPFDVIPSEQRIETLIKSILKEKKKATIDEIYQDLYINLTNGMTPDSEEIMHVLNRIAKKTKSEFRNRDVWELEAQVTIFQFSEELDPDKISEDNLHNIVIEKIAKLGLSKGYDIHIGEMEQNTNKKFKKISIPMGDNIQFGISKEGFEIIKQIDILWIKKHSIISVFEVEKSTTINSGITRFRNLFTELPNLNVKSYIVVPDKREKEALKKINSPANIKDGIAERVQYMAFSEIIG